MRGEEFLCLVQTGEGVEKMRIGFMHSCARCGAPFTEGSGLLCELVLEVDGEVSKGTVGWFSIMCLADEIVDLINEVREEWGEPVVTFGK
jgi:hypothetical protein